MLAGAGIKYYALTDAFVGSSLQLWLDSWWTALPASAKLTSLGFMIFGCGVEMAGVTVSKGIVKWFKGKELALAMGIEMAIARLGVFAVFRISPRVADSIGHVGAPVLLTMILLLVGLLAFLVYFSLTGNWNGRWVHWQTRRRKNLKSVTWENSLPARRSLLCRVYAYCIIRPFSVPEIRSQYVGVPLADSGQRSQRYFSWFPIGAMLLTPLLGAYLDNKGKGASMLIVGAVLMCLCHLTFALVPEAYFSRGIAYTAIIILGVSFPWFLRRFGPLFPNWWKTGTWALPIPSFSGYKTSDYGLFRCSLE